MGIFSKKKLLYQQKQVEDIIAQKIASLKNFTMNVNTIEDMGIEYINTIKDLDLQQNCNRYKWIGLPDYLTSWQIESMLYNRGSLCGYFNGGVLYILPFAQRKGVNAYGLPNAVQPVTYNGADAGQYKDFGKELIVNNSGKPNSQASAAILYDRIPFSNQGGIVSRMALNDSLVRYQADLLARIKINIQNANKKIVFWAENEKQAQALRTDLTKMYGTADPYVILIKGTEMGENAPFQTDIELETQELFEAWQSLNSIRCMVSGVANGGAFEKKERQITGELMGDEVQTDIVLDAGLQMRKLFLNQMRVIYPEYADILNKIRVEINEKSLAYEERDTEIESKKEEDDEE